MTHNQHQRDGSVSPVGSSRFERPIREPVNGVQRVFGTKSKNTDIPTSSTSSPASPTAMSTSTAHTRLASMTTTSTSMRTVATTAPSSLTSTPPSATEKELALHFHHHNDSISASDDTSDWFARFRSDPDLALPITDDCPDRATLAAVYDLPVYASDGSSRPFGSLYDPAYALHTRQLILFVRHFYCGACQAYLLAVARGITNEDYFAIPTPTSILVIGCGHPDLIKQYKKFTSCPFPIFADPSRMLFKRLAMLLSLNIGRQRPEYMHDISAPAWLAGQVKTIRKSLRDPGGIRKRDVLRGGNPMQIGGEFLFEEGEVVWCHRMRDYRGHAEVGVLRRVLGLDEA